MQVSILTTVDPLIRDVVALSLADTAAILDVGITPDGTDLTLRLPDGQVSKHHTDLTHPCITCSIRYAVISLLENNDVDRLVLALPPTIESIYVTPALADYLDDQLFDRLRNDPDAAGNEPFSLTSVVAAVDATSLPALLHATPLPSDGVLAEDPRDAGEVLFSILAHADTILTLGVESQSAIEWALIRHLNPDAELLGGLEQLSTELIFGREHDVDSAIMRVHPVWVPAAKNSGDGVWTDVLESPLPLNPDRLSAVFDALAIDGVLIRGCYWLPEAPDEIATWNSSGSSLAIGSAGNWDNQPVTRLVVTGVGEQPTHLRKAFRAALLGVTV